jgi:hypothetical protein
MFSGHLFVALVHNRHRLTPLLDRFLKSIHCVVIALIEFCAAFQRLKRLFHYLLAHTAPQMM